MTTPQAKFQDIRASCRNAQTRIMRLQQATNTQVGLTSSIREVWCDELRHIAQCFVAAQQTSAELEKAVKTEYNQLKGALGNALNELDLMRVQRDAADQEAKFLRGRLEEIMAQMRAMPNSRFDQPAHQDTWPTKNYSAEGTHTESAVDFLHQLPTTVDDMPISPQKNSSRAATRAGNNFPHNTRGNSSRGYRSNQSRFFGRADTAASNRSFSSESGQSTPEFYNGLAHGRFSGTPGALQGPFPAPPRTRQSNQKHVAGFSNSQLALTAKPFQPAQALARHPHNVHSAAASRPNTPAQRSQLVLRGEQTQLGNFSPGVSPQPSRADEERVLSIFGLFNEVKNWVFKYCASSTKESVAVLSSQHPQLWDYCLTITYPDNRQNAASHASFMLSNRATRCYFIARMLIQYVVQKLWSPEAWEGVDGRLTDILVGIKQRLDPKFGYDAALQPHERHALVEKRSRAIYDFISQPGWVNNENSRVTQTTSHLKSLVGPMTDSEGVDFETALAELNSISSTALRLSAVLNTSRLSFQFLFNDCGIKFSDQSHRALNSALPARELQAQQWRVMCVVTPGITYRNDAGVSVDPRFLAKANVLVMQ